MTDSPKELLAELLSWPDARSFSNDFLTRAERLFEEHGDRVRAKWMRSERMGYAPRVEPATLAEVLGSEPASEIVRAVLRERLEHGLVMISGVTRRWPHFFVESVAELRRLEEQVGGGSTPTVEIELEAPRDPATPRALSFPRTVFGQVLDRIALEIGDALRSLGGPT